MKKSCTLPYRVLWTETISNNTNNISAYTLVNSAGAVTTGSALGVAMTERLIPDPNERFPDPLQRSITVCTKGEYPVEFDNLVSFNALAVGAEITSLNGKLSTAVGSAAVVLQGGAKPVLKKKAVDYEGIAYGLVYLP